MRVPVYASEIATLTRAELKRNLEASLVWLQARDQLFLA